MFDRDPALVHAIVVGVDHYEYGEPWDLDGPARDALTTAEWLLEQGLPTKNIALFLSPRSWDSQFVKDRIASKTGLVMKDASHQALENYINLELPELEREALFVLWGGHAVAGDHEEKLFLFTADAALGLPFCARAEDIAAALADTRFKHLKQQVLVFDVCANQAGIRADPVPPVPVSLVRHRRDGRIAQCRMYAASLGNRAANISERRTGLFSTLLLGELQRCRSPGMRQFMDAFTALERAGATNGLAAQRPLMCVPGERLLPGPNGQLTLEERQLFDMIHALGLTHARLKRLYLQSQPLIELRSIPEDVEQWLLDLRDTRPRVDGYPSPLVEFVERLGRESSVAQMRAWAERHCKTGQYQTLTSKLDTDTLVGNRGTANVFVEVASVDARAFSWWLESGELEASNRQSIPIGSDGLRATLIRTLPDILAHAEGLVRGRFDIRIGFILPTDLLLSGLEMIVVRPASDDEDEEPTALNEQYTVLFHWFLRASRRVTRDFNNWGSLVESMELRLARDDGAGVIWLDQGAPGDKTRYSRASETLRTGPQAALCLGIEHPPGELAPKRLETVKQCLKQGVPCLFWWQQPVGPDQASNLRDRISNAFARQRPRNAPLSLWREQRALPPLGQIGVNSIVWDLPTYLPVHTPDQSLFEDNP